MSKNKRKVQELEDEPGPQVEVRTTSAHCLSHDLERVIYNTERRWCIQFVW